MRQAIVEQSLTQKISPIREAFEDVEQSAWGMTDTNDSVYRVLEEMESLPGRRVLIFIVFGYDAFSRHTFGELQTKVEAGNIEVYAIATGSDLRGWPGHPGRAPEPGFLKLKVEAFEVVDDFRKDFQVRAKERWRIEKVKR